MDMPQWFELAASAHMREIREFDVPEAMRQGAIARALAPAERATVRQRAGSLLCRLHMRRRGQSARVRTDVAIVKKRLQSI